MKRTLVLIIFFSALSNNVVGQKVSDINVRGKLMLELYNQDITSTDMIQSVEYKELKYKCAVPLTFGIYSYEFPSPHIAPGLFMIVDNKITFFKKFNYDHLYQKVDSVFNKKNVQHIDRLTYFHEIFKVLYKRKLSITRGGDVIIDSLFNPDAKLDADGDGKLDYDLKNDDQK